jgi:hypothetical protein
MAEFEVEETIGSCLLIGPNELGYLALSFSDFERAGDLPELEDLQGGGYTWHGIVDSLVRLRAPEIAEAVKFDPEGDTFVAVSKEPEPLRRVAALIEEALADPELLRRAIAEADLDLLE